MTEWADRDRVERAIEAFGAAERLTKRSYNLQRTADGQRVAAWTEYSLKQVKSELAYSLMTRGPEGDTDASLLSLINVREAGNQAAEIQKQAYRMKFKRPVAFQAAMEKGLEELEVYPRHRRETPKEERAELMAGS